MRYSKVLKPKTKKPLILQGFQSRGREIGILIGCGATAVVGAAIGISATPTFSAIVISFSVSVGNGLLFGYMPASRAANLNPIDALRSE